MSSSASTNAGSKVNQIIQSFFSKAAQVIVQSRVAVSPVYSRRSAVPKQNKWFNLELEEIDLFREELRLWKNTDYTANASGVPPLVVETTLDVRSLSPQQAVVLGQPSGSITTVLSGGSQRREIVLERWVVELVATNGSAAVVPAIDLPVVYKKAIVFFRSLYAYTRLMPTWDLKRRLAKGKLNVSPLSIGCGVLNGALPISSKGRIGLSKALGSTAGGTTGSGGTSGTSSSGGGLGTFTFSDLETPVGNIRVTVSYRLNTDFRLSDSEALLSNQFLKLDQSTQLPASGSSPASGSPYSLKDRRKSSLTSKGPLDTAAVGSAVQSLAHSGGTQKPPVSFIQPFRSPSLSASPSDSQSGGVGSGVGSGSGQRRGSIYRTGSNTSIQALRIPQRTMSVASTSSGRSGPPGDGGGGASSGSSDSVPKFSSSFGSRHNWRRSVSGGTKSRPQSLFGEASSVGSTNSSVLEPGSGIYIGDSDVGEFVKMVDSARLSTKDRDREQTRARPQSVIDPASGSGHGSGSGSGPGSGYLADHEGSSHKGNLLAKYQLLRSNHAALSDSLQSSIYLMSPQSGGPTSSPSASGPGPYSSSPASKASATGASYTPLVPSRLSEEFTVDRANAQALKKSQPSRSDPDTALSVAATMANPNRPPLGTTMPLDIPASYSQLSALQPSSHDARSGGHAYSEPRRPNYGTRQSRRFSFIDDGYRPSTDPESLEPSKETNDPPDDDELVFAMSDMHVTKDPPSFGTPWKQDNDTY